MTLESTPSELPTPPSPKVRKTSGRAGRRYNAVTHGFFTKELLLPSENKRHLAKLRKNLLACYQPVGAAELLLVEEIVAANWRLKRLLHAETNYIPGTSSLSGRPGGGPKADYRFSSWLNHNRYEVSLNRQLYRAMHELERIQKNRRDAEAAARQNDSESGEPLKLDAQG